MKDRSLQSTLRQWRRHLGHPATLGSVFGVGVLLAIMGPFDTGLLLPPLARLVYWVVLAGITYAIGYLTSDLTIGTAQRWIARSHSVGGRTSDWIAALIGAVAAGGMVTATVLGMNSIVFPGFAGDDGLPQLTIRIFVMAMIIAFLVDAVARTLKPYRTMEGSKQADPEDLRRDMPVILDRLSPSKRGTLIALSVEDHYVRVRTDVGEEMVLMRLSDAIRETAPIAGLQVHRSHWVAQDQIVEATRRGDGALLTMTAGPKIPVSRSNMPKLRTVESVRLCKSQF